MTWAQGCNRNQLGQVWGCSLYKGVDVMRWGYISSHPHHFFFLCNWTETSEHIVTVLTPQHNLPPPPTYWTTKRRELVSWGRAWVNAARQMMLSHHASYAITSGEHSNCDWLLMRCFISLIIWKTLSTATCVLFGFICFFSPPPPSLSEVAVILNCL